MLQNIFEAKILRPDEKIEFGSCEAERVHVLVDVSIRQLLAMLAVAYLSRRLSSEHVFTLETPICWKQGWKVVDESAYARVWR